MSVWRSILTTGWLGVAAVAYAQPEVRALLETRCLSCHGEKLQLGKLDLRTREAALRGGEHGPAIVAGKGAAESRLYRHVAGLEKPRMPMGGQLSDTEIALIEKWLNDGSAWPAAELKASAPAKKEVAPEDRTVPESARNFWAFQKPKKASPPAGLGRHPIDAFLAQALRERGLTAAPKANAETLVRRAYLDLLGLPPTPEQVTEFVADRSADAWPKLIDRLLASPHYGERWGRHWLDVARYADSNGFEHDFDRPHAWRYRDYVIASFNADKPYDQFLREQLAGDELRPVTPERLIATGFLRNYAKVGFREKDNPQFRFDYLDDMIATLGRGVMGLTVQCARCHDHKFDPIPQRDYYALQSSLWGYVEVEHPLVSEAEASAYQAKMQAVDERVKPLRDEIKQIEAPYIPPILERKYRTWPAHIQEAVFTPEEKRTPGQVLLANQIIRTTSASAAEIERAMKPEGRERKRALVAQIAAIEKERPKPIPVAMGITDGDYRFTPDGAGDEPAPGKGIKREAIEGSFLAVAGKPYQVPPVYFLHHGDQGSPGKLMPPGFPQVLTGGSQPETVAKLDHQQTSGRRLALARWLGSRENPLTARVMVNRIWHHHFGRGIVTSLDNFGKMGDAPTHPELLDWLAVEFMDRGWSIKQMHRLMMTSEAYQRSSGFTTAENESKDAANLYWWRFAAQRLEAEIVRDSILAAAGVLNTQVGGEAVFPPLPKEILARMDKGIWKQQAEGPETWRRSVYVYRKRGLPFPLFEVFDLPDQNITCGRRTVSTVATQALTLMNNEFVVAQSARLADRVATEAGPDTGARIERAYRLTLGRGPTAAELSAAREFLREQPLSGLAHVLLNLNEFIYLR